MKRFYLILTFTLLSFSAFSRECYRGELLQEPLKQEALAPLGDKCRIILVRHGETAWNAAEKKQGWADIPLNEKGRDQAAFLADKLANIEMKTMYASALSRAVDTAKIIADCHEGSTVIPDPALRFFRNKIRIFDFLKSNKRKKREMTEEITTDSLAYLKELSRKHPGETVVVVTHARVIKYLLMELGGYKRNGVKIKNGAIIRVVGDGQMLSIEL